MNLSANSSEHRLVLLAPRQFAGTTTFGNNVVDATRHAQLVAAMQRFRGEIYLADGAIRPSDLSAEGLHRQAADADSWHVLCLGPNDAVKGCSRYRVYEDSVRFDRLGVSHSEIARSDVWAHRLYRAVQNEQAIAHERGVSLVEVGGWAVAEEARLGAGALRLALSTFALARLLGGCIGLTTATVRHCSATILRKLGGRLLNFEGQDIPRYFDSAYDCEMEILRFDSAEPSPRHAEILDRLSADLALGEVVHASVPAASTPTWARTPQRSNVPLPMSSQLPLFA